MRKIIRALSKAWDVKTTTLKELNDNEEMDFSAFMENLKTYEMKIKAREERESQKKANTTFKASPRELRKKSVASSTTSNDEELTLPVKKYEKNVAQE